ncbi:hypothetical protein BDW02DRAFT_36620 [Decorospora gaudefroyi]|uniref:Uncharacterized protein n=1 Tax=Decorospora gaudefroyi TaxID=184978 RepID=A0A6A5KBN2_9PLEO|nr:hypothetical protein BDW02DRAFT_36620 [Decorospora gaudefroyi]
MAHTPPNPHPIPALSSFMQHPSARLMDLPIELRVMIYDLVMTDIDIHLAVEPTVEVPLSGPDWKVVSASFGPQPPSAATGTYGLLPSPMSIFRTCKLAQQDRTRYETVRKLQFALPRKNFARINDLYWVTSIFPTKTLTRIGLNLSTYEYIYLFGVVSIPYYQGPIATGVRTLRGLPALGQLDIKFRSPLWSRWRCIPGNVWPYNNPVLIVCHHATTVMVLAYALPAICRIPKVTVEGAVKEHTQRNFYSALEKRKTDKTYPDHDLRAEMTNGFVVSHTQRRV